jgi:hypothetical protein
VEGKDGSPKVPIERKHLFSPPKPNKNWPIWISDLMQCNCKSFTHHYPEQRSYLKQHLIKRNIKYGRHTFETALQEGPPSYSSFSHQLQAPTPATFCPRIRLESGPIKSLNGNRRRSRAVVGSIRTPGLWVRYSRLPTSSLDQVLIFIGLKQRSWDKWSEAIEGQITSIIIFSW